MSDARKEVVIDLSRIAWPQSVCGGCGKIGSGIDPYRYCRCSEPYATVYSPAEYHKLMAGVTSSRLEEWARRRAG